MAEWQPIETVPNDVFDVLAKYYCAHMDTFMYARFTGCIQVNSVIYWAWPGARPLEHYNLVENGYKPTHWMPIPELPK